MIYISVIGDAVCDEQTEATAEEVGRLIARRGAVLISGGLGGVMEASCRGAKQAKGTTIGILPGLNRADGNPYLDYSICTGVGHARNLAVALSGDRVIAVGGEFGTLSEIGFACKMRRRLILLGSWDIRRQGQAPKDIVVAQSAEEAVRLACE